MNAREDVLKRMAELRRKAEGLALEMSASLPEGNDVMSPAETRQSIHELRVHQIELEMQNEELRRTQIQLDAARARYFDLYDLAPVGYCTLSKEGAVLEINSTALQLLGVTRETLMHQPMTRCIFIEDQDIFYLLWKRLMDHGGPQACELRMQRRTAEVFWAHIEAVIVIPPDAEPHGDSTVRMVMHDVSERKQSEMERAEIEAQLQHAKKLESLGVLAGGVAHDFNNLLTSILGNANLGSLSVEPDGRVAPFFEAIEKAALRAADLTRQLLAYVGKGRGQESEVDLDIVLKEVVQLLNLSIPPRVRLHYDLADRLPFVKGDATQIFQMVMNIVVNASESIPEGVEGVVILRTRSEDLDDTFIESTRKDLPLKPGPYATFEVTDTGVGMTPEVLARAFEPFFSTKFPGRGLGLAAMEGILRSHHGGMCIRSQPGHGTSFKVFLPAMQEARSFSPSDLPPAWTGQGILLIVDDEEIVRDLARHMAERLGFTTVEAKDGFEAVDTFNRIHKTLSMVILDLTMPKMGGRAAFKAMQKIDATVPVVISSGYDLLATESPLAGLAGVLHKPYRFAEFQGLVHRVMEGTVAPAHPGSGDAFWTEL